MARHHQPRQVTPHYSKGEKLEPSPLHKITLHYKPSKILEIMARQKMITVKMTSAMYSAMCSIMYASKQTFVNKNDEGEWESNEDFICTLTDEEREALMNF